MRAATILAVLVGLVCGIGVPASIAQTCSCDGDVNNDGIVNLQDWLCIQSCKANDCTCCLSSCDINCDGVVDSGDAGADPVNEDSTWHCLFVGMPPEACCLGPVGACCDLDTGTCLDGTLASGCVGASEVWTEGLSCVQVSCPTPPVGACCDTGTGTCVDNVFAAQCAGVNDVWSQGMNCVAVGCAGPPTGACCNLGNGLCQDGVSASACSGPDDVWTMGVSCASAGCAVPPQDPCLCDADVNNDGIVNLQDWLCIQDCKAGDCTCCLSSCDINCDGVVDNGDAGADPITEDSAWHCLFAGMPPESCCLGPVGACCDLDTGTCLDGVFASGCVGANEVWTEGVSCVQVSCPTPPLGACCDTGTGMCVDGVFAAQCAGVGDVWSQGMNCVAVGCAAPPTGACCNFGNGVCLDDVWESACSGPDDVWTLGVSCASAGCAVPPQDPCLCDGDVNNDGIVNLPDWLCIQACKAGDCTCCLSSCDVNCDGVVDNGDAGVDPLSDMSTWNCLFQGGDVGYCCSSNFLALVQAGVPIPTVSTWGVVVLALLLVTSGTLILRRGRVGSVRSG